MESVATRQKQLQQLQLQIRACRRCRDAGFAVSGQGLCSGPAAARILLVGPAPSRADGLVQRLWNDAAGQLLLDWLAWAGLEEADLRAHHYLTTAIKCAPGPALNDGKRSLSPQQAQLCRPHLAAELALLSPALIVPVGRLAVDFFGGRRMRLDRVVGRAVCVDNTWIVPLPDPALAAPRLEEAAFSRRLARSLALLRELVRSLA